MSKKRNDRDYSITISNDQLKIKIKMSMISHYYRSSVLISCILSMLAFFWLIGSGSFFYGVIIPLLATVLYTLPFTLFYIFYNGKYEWKFDKSTQIIDILKDYRYFIKTKSLNINDIESLIYLGDYRYVNMDISKLLLVGKNSKTFKVYKGDEDDCKKIGQTISKFIERPIKHKG